MLLLLKREKNYQNKMQNLVSLVRSKIPASLNRYINLKDDERIPLTPSNIKYEEHYRTSLSFNNNNFTESISYQNFDGTQRQATFENSSDFESSDLKSNNNLINEWQAAYNVTNAIQVNSIKNSN